MHNVQKLLENFNNKQPLNFKGCFCIGKSTYKAVGGFVFLI